jgi:hypothetical protein
MPSLPRRFLIAAAIALLSGIGLGLLLLVRRELFDQWPSPLLVSAHAHLILVGAVLETIVGTALWLFPRPSPRALHEPTASATASWWLLTGGTAVRAVAETSRAWSGATMLRWAVVAGGTAQVLGLLCAIAALKARVRPSVRTG